MINLRRTLRTYNIESKFINTRGETAHSKAEIRTIRKLRTLSGDIDEYENIAVIVDPTAVYGTIYTIAKKKKKTLNNSKHTKFTRTISK